MHYSATAPASSYPSSISLHAHRRYRIPSDQERQLKAIAIKIQQTVAMSKELHKQIKVLSDMYATMRSSMVIIKKAETDYLAARVLVRRR